MSSMISPKWDSKTDTDLGPTAKIMVYWKEQITIALLFLLTLSTSATTHKEKGVSDIDSIDFVERLLSVLRKEKVSDTQKVPEEKKIEIGRGLSQLPENDVEGDVDRDPDGDLETRDLHASACRGEILLLTAPTGTVSTPYYGTHKYPNGAKCQWRIQSQNPTDKIQLKFKTPFSIEEGTRCQYDSLSIFDGTGPTGSAVGRYCNSHPPPVTILRNTNAVYLQFVTDYGITGAGFTLDYTIIPGQVEQTQACTGKRLETITGQSGTITSPNFPKGYSNNLRCRWVITVPNGQRVRLEFREFETEADVGECPYDRLIIYDGSSATDERIGEYCGKQVPKDIVASGRSVAIVFVSDDSVSKKGFKIAYQGIQVSPPEPAPTPFPGKDNTKPQPQPQPQPPGPQVDLNCTFEQGNMCLWTAGAGGSINWKVKMAKQNTYIISNGIRWGSTDHTLDTSTGHYLVIDGGEEVSMKNAKGFLISPLLSVGPDGGRCLIVWYNMYFTKGALQVVMRREGEKDEVIWQRDGFQGNGWHKGRISLVSASPYRLVLVGTRGSIDKETGIAVDDVSFENKPCLAIPLNCGISRVSKRSILNELLHLNPSPQIAEDISRRVLGGQESSVGMWPWIVNIRTQPPGSTSYMACGGSLIDRQWILTAAHCFESGGQWLTDPMNIQLKLGEAHLGRTAWEESQINIRPSKVIIHPQRSQESMGQVAPFDVALVKLPHKVSLSEHINVVCLPPSGSTFRPGTSCVVSGWGLTGDGSSTEKLLHVNLDLLSNRMCTRFFGSSIGNDLLCAKHSRAVKAACKGDSGGPLVCKSGDHYILAGVVSWGVPCAQHERPLPSVFSKVTYYLPWIESTINAEELK